MDTDIPDFVMGECPAPILYDHLVGPPFEGVNGVTTPTPGYDNAKKRFAEAVNKFADHSFVEAARGFLVVAQWLDDAARDFLIVEHRHDNADAHAEIFRTDRIHAYQNAAFAYEEAKAFDEGRRELTQRAHHDPACAAEIERIVRELNDWERHCKPVQQEHSHRGADE